MRHRKQAVTNRAAKKTAKKPDPYQVVLCPDCKDYGPQRWIDPKTRLCLKCGTTFDVTGRVLKRDAGPDEERRRDWLPSATIILTR